MHQEPTLSSKALNATKLSIQLCVTGKNIDDLQAVMRHLKSLDLKAPLVFDNFK